ncbi:predicted protein [Postia placenta Mad-698-R]|nr:predicted protein [Postia placenta Mad-698-R]
MLSENELEILFPLPSSPPAPHLPQHFPGVTHGSKVAVTEVLKSNHIQRHAFVNERQFHNSVSHASHHLLAIFALGGPAPVFDAIFDVQLTRTLPAITSPGQITSQNFYEHLGEPTYYNAYLSFFREAVLQKGGSAVMEEYIFAPSANFDDSAKTPRRMLSRMLAVLFHPMIHAGNGLEFGIPGLIAEGKHDCLAQAAVHPIEGSGLLVESDFSSVIGATDRLSSLHLDIASGEETQQAGVHVFEILARVLKDDRFSPAALGFKPYDDLIFPPPYEAQVDALRSKEILEYTDKWLVDGSDNKQVQLKIEELCWLNTVMYAAGGWGGRKNGTNGKFNADFFLMHSVTSSLFLPSFVAHLSPTSTAVLLRAYLRTSLVWWVARGRPTLPIRDFYASTSATPNPYAAQLAKTDKTALPLATPAANAWLPLIQGAIMHTDEHFCKLQRALAHFASRYGHRPAGHFAGMADACAAIDGLELLDGTLFLRAAGLTAEQIVDKGEAPFFWDLRGFFA